jgi:salicylate hydroxylase
MLDVLSSQYRTSLRRLLQLADSVTPVPELRYEPLDSWVHEDNKVLLVGDAAAPYPLPGNYTISVAIEDASVLGALLGRVRANEQIPALLAAYDELRPARAADLARRDLHLLDGWQRLSLHQASPNADSDGVLDEDEAMLKRFEEYLHAVGYETFEAANYDCYEVAGDWLQQWPSLLQSSTTVLISPMVDVYRDVTVREHHDEGYYSEC